MTSLELQAKKIEIEIQLALLIMSLKDEEVQQKLMVIQNSLHDCKI